jgi:hypothetical protein
VIYELELTLKTLIFLEFTLYKLVFKSFYGLYDAIMFPVGSFNVILNPEFIGYSLSGFKKRFCIVKFMRPPPFE